MSTKTYFQVLDELVANGALTPKEANEAKLELMQEAEYEARDNGTMRNMPIWFVKEISHV